MSERDALPVQSRLSRLRSALSTRDWLGVGIEILIVTVGVLLAFEIEQWGQRRERAAEERQFLERLYSEYGRADAELRPLAREQALIVDAVGTALDHYDRPEALQRFAGIANFGCRQGRFMAAPFNDTSVEELVASGRINIISDPELRREIRDLAAAQASSAKQIDASRLLMMNQIDTLNDYYRFSRANGRSICRVDWPRMAIERRGINTATLALEVQSAVLGGRREVMERIARVRQLLACDLDKPECRR